MIRKGMSVALVAAATLAPASQADRRVPASQPRRVALVVGNDAYATMPLRNAVADARAMAEALRGLGFDADLIVNADLAATERAVNTLVGKLCPGDAGLFYYAGHGIQVEGVNYLVGVSFRAQDEVDAKYQSYDANRVHDRMLARCARVVVVILDACRDNPFRTTRSGAGGLAQMNTDRGSFIAFATAPSQTASDNPGGKNGLFTAQLVETLREPGLSIDQVFSRVREKVHAASGGTQLPWVGSSMIGEFVFNGASTAGPPPPPAAAADSEARLRAETAFWESIKDSRNAADFEVYLTRFPDGTFASLARSRLEQPSGTKRVEQTEGVGVFADWLGVWDVDVELVQEGNSTFRNIGTDTRTRGPDGAQLLIQHNVVFARKPCQIRGSIAWDAANRKYPGTFIPSSAPGPCHSESVYNALTRVLTRWAECSTATGKTVMTRDVMEWRDADTQGWSTYAVQDGKEALVSRTTFRRRK